MDRASLPTADALWEPSTPAALGAGSLPRRPTDPAHAKPRRRPYAQGRLDGSKGVDPALGREFYEAATRFDQAKQAWQDAVQRRDELRRRREELQHALATMHAQQARAEQDDKFTRARLEEVAEDLRSVQQRRRQAETEPAPSLARGVLYALAAAFFTAGDLIVAHAIVSQVVRIANDVEAWLFAFGIAAVPVVLKLVYDEVIARHRTSRVRLFESVALAVSVLVLVTVGLLGYARADVIRAEANNRMLPMTWSHVAALVLVALAFAVAGALSLSAALEDFQRWWQRRVLRRREARLLAQRAELETRLAALQSELAPAVDADARQAQLRALEADLAELERQLETHRDASFAALEARRIAAYRLGHALGQATGESGMRSSPRPSSGRPRPDRPKPVVPSSLRPHVAARWDVVSRWIR